MKCIEHYCTHLRVKHVKNREQCRQFHSYLKRAQSLGVDVQLNDGCMLLDGTPVDVNQTKFFIKARQGQPFKMCFLINRCIMLNFTCSASNKAAISPTTLSE